MRAVEHLCADPLVRAEPARTALYAAAVTAGPVEIAGAGPLADDSAVRDARDRFRVPGGRALTWEADARPRPGRARPRSGERPSAGEAEEALAADPERPGATPGDPLSGART